MTPYEQLSLFCPYPASQSVAIHCWTKDEVPIQTAEDWMKRLVPDGEYVVNVGGHNCVLRPTNLSVAKIQKGHEFYHYLIGATVYSGIFVGR